MASPATSPGPLYDQKQVTTWLSWLARTMLRHGQSVFLLEQLQPSALLTRAELRSYLYKSRIAAGLLTGAGVGLPLGFATAIGESADRTIGVLLGLAYGLVFGVGMALATGVAVAVIEGLRHEWRTDPAPQVETPGRRWRLHQLLEIGIIALTFTMTMEVVNAWVFASLDYLYWGFTELTDPAVMRWLMSGGIVGVLGVMALLGRRQPRATRASLVAGTVGRLLVLGLLVFGVLVIWTVLREDMVAVSGVGERVLVFVLPVTAIGVGLSWGVRSVARTPSHDIQTVDRLDWSWRRAAGAGLKAMAWSAGACAAIVLVVALFSGVLSEALFGMLLALPFVLIVGVVAGCFGGLTRAVAKTSSPNEGIRLSTRNAVFSGVILSAVLFVAGSLFWYGFRLMIGETSNLPEALAFGAALAIISVATAGFRYGGLDVLQHRVLRWELARRGYAPLRYVEFLDHAATQLGFLQKVGGGYMFIHRYLLEHFASAPGPGHEPAGREPVEAAVTTRT